MNSWNPMKQDFNSSYGSTVYGGTSHGYVKKNHPDDSSLAALFVSGIPCDYNQQKIANMFQTFGFTVIDVVIPRKQLEEPRQTICAIVKLENLKSANAAIEKFNGKPPLKLKVQIAKPKQNAPFNQPNKNHDSSFNSFKRQDQDSSFKKMDNLDSNKNSFNNRRDTNQFQKNSFINKKDNFSKPQNKIQSKNCNDDDDWDKDPEEKENEAAPNIRPKELVREESTLKVDDVKVNLEERFSSMALKDHTNNSAPINGTSSKNHSSNSSAFNGTSSINHSRTTSVSEENFENAKEETYPPLPCDGRASLSVIEQTIRESLSLNKSDTNHTSANSVDAEMDCRSKNRAKMCIACNQKGSVRCSICFALYCSVKCQKYDWYYHRESCIAPPSVLDEFEDAVSHSSSTSNLSGSITRSTGSVHSNNVVKSEMLNPVPNATLTRQLNQVQNISVQQPVENIQPTPQNAQIKPAQQISIPKKQVTPSQKISPPRSQPLIKESPKLPANRTEEISPAKSVSSRISNYSRIMPAKPKVPPASPIHCKHLKNVEIKINESYQIMPTYAHDGEFYFNIVSQEDSIRMVELIDLLAVVQEKGKVPEDLIPMQLVCTYFEEDQAFYRARVIAVDGSKVLVHFIDFGNTAEVTFKDCRDFNRELLEIPNFCFKLGNLKGPQLPEDIFNQYQGSGLNVKITGLDPVEGIISNEDGEVLLSSAYVVKSKSPPKEVAPVISNKTTPAYTLDNSSQLELPVNKTSKVMIVDVNTENALVSIWPQDESNPESVGVMVAELSESISTFCNDKPTGPYIPELCEIVLGLWRADGNWYRAAVVEVKENDAYCLFVDFGNFENIAFSDIKKMEDQFMKHPCMVVHCQLSGLKEKVSSALLQKVKEEIGEQELQVYVESIVDNVCNIKIPCLEDKFKKWGVIH